MKRIILVWLLVSISGLVSAQYDWEGKVVKVIDGNTIEIQSSEGQSIVIVFSDIDCPEVNQLFGEQAKKFTEKRLKNKTVCIISKGRDRTGATTGIIFCNDKNFSYELVKAGYAWYNRNKGDNADLDSLEVEAKAKRLGLWKEENPTPPWIHRRKESMLVPKTS